MFSWHDEACNSIRIVFSEELDVPLCAGERCVAPRRGRTRAAPGTALPAPTPTTTFELTWPSSLALVDRETSDSSLVKEGSTEQNSSSPNNASQDVVADLSQRTTSRQEPTSNSSSQDENPYQPLVARKIRLLVLSGGNYLDPIKIQLQIADLQERPQYEALSYTWADEDGDSSKCERAYIGQRWDILPITKNCFNALRRLRWPVRSRRLWVDAICINQNDVGERSHQVGIMQDIYNYAERVLIYLGEDAEEPDTASSIPWNYHTGNHRPLPLHIDLTQKPYFKRVCVIQEIAAARDAWILFGTKGDRWDSFLSAEAKRTTKSPEGRTTGVATASNMQPPQEQKLLHVLQNQRETLVFSDELPKLLHATVRCEATDRRDKIYALLGLFPDANNVGLTADYSLSEAQVFSGLTAYLLSKSTAFLLPVFAALQPASSTSFPSWAVDWSSATNLDCMDRYLAETYSRLTASREPESVSYIHRFHQNGLSILQGRLIVSLSSCVLGPECQRGPPGVLGRVFYGGRGIQVPDAIPNWAEPTDELCQIQGLDGHALVLRPVPKAPKTYRFVAICQQPKFHRLLRCLDSIDRTATLLFSTWKYILKDRVRGELWFLAETWDTIEAVCRNIKDFWNLEKTLCRSLDSTKDPRRGENPSREEEAKAAKPRNTNLQEMWPQHKETPSDSPQMGVANQRLSKKSVYDLTVHQPFPEQTSEVGKFGKMAADEIDPFGSLGEHLSTAVPHFRSSSKENHGWEPLSGLKSRNPGRGMIAIMDSMTMTSIFGWELGPFAGIPTAEEMALARRDPGSYKHKFPWQFQSLEILGELLRSLSGRNKSRRLLSCVPSDFARWLLGPHLGDKIFFFNEWTRWLRETEEENSLDLDRVLPWLQDALNLETRPLPRERESYGDPNPDTWAADFIRTWTLLTKDIRPPGSSVVEPADLPPQETEEQLLREQGYLAAAEAKWAPLLDLVKQTEARLLPMKDEFIRAKDTHDESMDNVPWDEIFIA
ncbi:hypothetical protein CFIO01_06356 [Colletotrichum fioriniae PJ7]|uniref:Heterokaryon incompatibility domain-containing protein n=1 Tax=Colletotrichum fioriniae PJ7 TaxID=1445577 RepID=A0A010QVK6_9PEZI|nr:hypothetical protein CFIO01_06356 [Colletotrichum fioriniae PJ7]